MRAPFVIGATLAGIAGVIAFHPHSTSSPATFTAPGTRAVGGTSTNSGATASSAPPATGSDPKRKDQSAPTSTTSPSSSSANGTAGGKVTQYQFGVLQVTATVSGGRITNVSTQVQSADPRSQQIDDDALPILRSQALSAQSSNIQGVSGATYTSQAFVSSLQSALNSLGFSK